MFSHIDSTDFPPKNKPLMVYDGNCGFCKYWVIKWKLMSGESIDYKPFQKVASSFKDIHKKHFAEAVRFIDTGGKVYSGPEAAYYTYYKRGKAKFLFKAYKNHKWFKKLNDKLYQWVADNRDFVFRVCIKMLGKNPRNTQHLWIFYLLGIAAIISLIFLGLACI